MAHDGPTSEIVELKLDFIVAWRMTGSIRVVSFNAESHMVAVCEILMKRRERDGASSSL